MGLIPVILDDFPYPGDKDLFTGIQEINKNNYKEALKYFEKGSTYDNEYASLFTAIIYFTGFGLPKRDSVKAMNLLKQIASQWENPVAQYLIAAMYDEGDDGVMKNTKTCTEWYLLSANNGWLFSIGNVGYAYTFGCGVKEDHKKAIEWIEKVLKNEDTKTDEILYLFGNKNFKVNFSKADKDAVANALKMTGGELVNPVAVLCDANYKNPSWLKIARVVVWDLSTNKSSSALAPCQHYIADIYLNGKNNVPRDSEKAMYWQRKSANNGNANSCRALGLQYEIGTHLKQDYKEAMKCYEKPKYIVGGYSENFHIGGLYYRGLGVKKDWKKALEYLVEAAFLDKNERAFLLMGIIYEAGKYGVSRNIKEAVKCYMEIFDLGNPAGAIALALIYCKGVGVKKDEGKTVHWFIQAMTAGCQDAQVFLSLIEVQGFQAAANIILEFYDIEFNLFT
ncbi:hypothetical protein HPULCUR_001229 [Helicostylum pulchrum]|uniref:Beta-lactamase n=1 Tax=Helicostylum pulchrum TaxID=562976 RepID=A0ABP9XM39_9FUNG